MSTILYIPLVQKPLFSQQTTLNGIEYQLTFDYQQKTDRWFLSFADAAGAVILSGVKVTTNWNLLRKWTSRQEGTGLVYYDPVNDTPPGWVDWLTRPGLVWMAP